MKKIFGLALLGLSLSLGAANEMGKGGAPPSKPLQSSALGYLTVSPESLQLPPMQNKYFIMPQSELPLLEESQDSYMLLLKQDSGSMLCVLPKQKRYTLVMDLLPNGSIRFRGGVEAKTSPIILKKGEELPLLRQDEEGNYALLSRKKQIFTVFIPRDTAGLSFDKRSAFEKYNEAQKQKNLKYYQGAWIPVEEANAREKEASGIKESQETQWQIFLKAAAEGYLLRKNGQLVTGKLKGQDQRQLLFETNGTETWLGCEDLAPLPLEQILAQGRLFEGNASLSDALACFLKNELGETARNLEKAQAKFRQIDASTPDAYNSALGKLKELGKLQGDLEGILKEDGTALYQYQVFPREELRYHLASNHILFKGKIWLLPDQPCTQCKCEGQITCPSCKGVGSTTTVCAKCQQGIAPCPICNGEGWKDCQTCKGNGGFPRICSKCGGTGLIWKTIVSHGSMIIYTPGGGAIVPNGPATSAGGAETGGAGASSYKYVEEQCPLCLGTGEEKIPCADCGGRGSIPCPKTQTCPYCKGKGVIKNTCQTCNGQKKLPCPACEGKGYKGAPQDYSPPAVKSE